MTTELGKAVARCKNLTRDGRDINTVNVNCDDLETILAELGRLSGGEPFDITTAERLLMDVEFKALEIGLKTLSGQVPNMKNSREACAKLIDYLRSTRPPALGELSDEQWFHLYCVMNHEWVMSKKMPSSNKIAKAAREFLGKVDA